MGGKPVKVEKRSAKARRPRAEPDLSKPAAAEPALVRARLQVRIKFGPEFQLGPGKIELLEHIAATGSISAAARAMGMSYRRAWLLVDEISRMWTRPVVTRATGGSHGGGAEMTDFGRALIAAYRRIEERSRRALREELAPFETDIAEF